jgi:hypothetical protein
MCKSLRNCKNIVFYFLDERVVISQWTTNQKLNLQKEETHIETDFIGMPIIHPQNSGHRYNVANKNDDLDQKQCLLRKKEINMLCI